MPPVLGVAATVNKSAEAFRTISEVAEELDVPKHVLRFWEQKFPQIRPMKRGGGRRYYRPEDLELLRGIRHLLHLEGYTIRGVQKILRLQGVDEVKRCWMANAVQPTVPVDKPSTGTKAKSKAKSSKAPPAPPPAANRLPPDLVRTLQGILNELDACRSLLTDTRSDQAATKARRADQ